MKKNFIFISPTFPKNYYQFPKAWKELGGRSLCIGEDDYNTLSKELKDSMDEYYRVNSMLNYDEMYRAVAWFAHKYGKIDWLESNNEFWLVQDAQLRTDFNITSGDKNDSVMRFKTKANMKAYYQQANCKTARYHLPTNLNDGKQFIEKVNYPIIVKPNDGVGASKTWKINNEEELISFYQDEEVSNYIMEEYLDGYIVSYDGLTDMNGNIIYKTSHIFPTPIMDVVQKSDENVYWNTLEIDNELDSIASKVIKAFDIKGRFFHTEYFKLTKDKPGLANKGEYLGLEVNMRPPGGITPDMFNFADDINIYEIYAKMAMGESYEPSTKHKYTTVYVGLRNKYNYAHNVASIFTKYRQNIVMHDVMPKILQDALGEEYYVARFNSDEERIEFINYICAKK